MVDSGQQMNIKAKTNKQTNKQNKTIKKQTNILTKEYLEMDGGRRVIRRTVGDWIGLNLKQGPGGRHCHHQSSSVIITTFITIIIISSSSVLFIQICLSKFVLSILQMWKVPRWPLGRILENLWNLIFALHNWPVAQLPYYTITQLHNYTIAQSHNCTITQLHNCTVAQLHNYAIAQSQRLFWCISIISMRRGVIVVMMDMTTTNLMIMTILVVVGICVGVFWCDVVWCGWVVGFFPTNQDTTSFPPTAILVILVRMTMTMIIFIIVIMTVVIIIMTLWVNYYCESLDSTGKSTTNQRRGSKQFLEGLGWFGPV